jgi:hypothetical protein
MRRQGHHRIGWLLGLVLLGQDPLLAGEGIVRTLAGKSFAGQIRLGSNQVLLANLSESFLLRLPMTNLLELRMLSPPPSARADASFRRGELAQTPVWGQTNIGPIRDIGQIECQAGRVRLKSRGTQLSDQEDSWVFTYRSWQGDVEIVARLLALSPLDAATPAGLMMRESLHPQAKQIFIGFNPRGGVLQWREQSGAPSAQRSVRDLFPWLRLKRDGDWFYVYTSQDGRRWRLMDKIYLTMEPALLVGCALTGQESATFSSSRPRLSRGNDCLFDQVRTGTGLRHHSFVPQLHLRSGSVIVDDIAFLEPSGIHPAGPAPWPVIPLTHIARLDFQWIPARLGRQIPTSRPGVLLLTGEFFEGDLKELESGRCVMSTVLFGLRRYDVYHEIVSILLRQASPAPAPCEVRTWDGSTLRGTLQSLSEQGVMLQEPVLGRVHVPFHALKEISRRRSD